MLGTLGASMFITGVVGAIMNTEKACLKRSIRRYLSATKLSPGVKMTLCKRQNRSYRTEFTLPYGYTIEEFKSHLKGLEQATASHIRFRHLFGSTCELTFGFHPFYEKMNFTDELPMEPLAIPLYTPFGLRTLDFKDETCCHLLCGGATRMGKSAFLRYVATHLILSTEGNVDIIFIDHKVSDLYMFRDIPQIRIAETSGEARAYLKDVLSEINRRKNLLKNCRDAVDLREYRSKYTDDKVNPMFVIIDEYGRFADDKVIQEIVTEIAETAGYVDVHLIISSQRPDAKDVLKPRIKANIVTRMSFATFDEVNSKIILDIPDAAHIGKIQGRAILVDGHPELVQVPYMSPSQVQVLLNKYRRDDYDEARQIDYPIPETFPGNGERPDRSTSLSGSSQTSSYSEPDFEAPVERRLRASDSAGERSSIPIHAESGDHSSSVEQNRTFSWFSGYLPSFEETEDF
mgnify:CR=1 FL=1